MKLRAANPLEMEMLPIRHLVCALGLILALALPHARADDKPAEKPGPLTPEQAADAVLVAVKAKDQATVDALAGRNDPDPWMVADELCIRGEHDAAGLFAKAAPRADVEQLPAYVLWRRDHPESPELQRVREESEKLDAAGDRKGAAALLEDLPGAQDDVTTCRTLNRKAVYLEALGDFRKAREARSDVAERAGRIGWRRLQFLMFSMSGASACRLGDHALARDLLLRAVGIYEKRGVDAFRSEDAADGEILAMVFMLLATTDFFLWNWTSGVGHARHALEICRVRRNSASLPMVLFILAHLELLALQPDRARAAANEALALGVLSPDQVSSLKVVINLLDGVTGGAEDPLDSPGSPLGGLLAAGGPQVLARALIARGATAASAGRHADARAAFEKALSEFERIGDISGIGDTSLALALLLGTRGEFRAALELLDRARASHAKAGSGAALAQDFAWTGQFRAVSGDYEGAMEDFRSSLDCATKAGSSTGVTQAWAMIGNLHLMRGRVAEAMQAADRAGVPDPEAAWSMTHSPLPLLIDLDLALGRSERAESNIRSVLAARHALAVPAKRAIFLRLLARARRGQGDRDGAIDLLGQSVAVVEKQGGGALLIYPLVDLGEVLLDAGDLDRAGACFERAYRIANDSGYTWGLIRTLAGIAEVHRARGELAEASVREGEALVAAEESGDDAGIVRLLWSVAETRLAKGDARGAMKASRRAVAIVPRLAAGLADEEGARVREGLARGYATCLRAAFRSGAPTEVSWALESGRAGTLLEALGGSRVVRNLVLPDALLRAEAEAQSAVAAARIRFDAARKSGILKEMREQRARWKEARQAWVDVMDRIQREEKAAAAVAYPTADDLETIRGRLQPGEALVEYGLPGPEALALVVTKDAARVVDLGQAAPIEAACEALQPSVNGAPTAVAVAALRDAVTRPLALESSVRRVLVSPDGAVSFVPFSLLLPDREVVYLPSGTVHGLLREDRHLRGATVLALGAPDYQANVHERAAEIYRGSTGRPLVPLPATRAEVEAIGQRVLLGKDASEGKFREAVAERPRWRAVHFACHGLIDSDRPMLSSLALTAGGEDDGFLTALEILRLRIPADLVVLSACETGKGRVYKTEGIVGLTRAFMFAGAPRVICSLWKVDDEATQALMIKFYELWNPRDGKGLGAAAALKKAQEFVRKHEKWKHPYYWAAWVLWGLPE